MALGSNILWRVYGDYLAPDRYGDYRRLVESSLRAGFRHYTIAQMNAKIIAGAVPPSEKIFVHRHDIDTDIQGAQSFFEIEREYGIAASYYFRLTTIDVGLMREIHRGGSEVGYHYEELATFAKRNGLTSRQTVLRYLPAITQEFENNLRRLEMELGFRIRTVAAHGDFANRRLNLSNSEILADPALRERLGIECESYDPILMNFFDAYHSDGAPNREFKRGSPSAALQSKRRICLLTHPRHWRANAVVNTKDNCIRLAEELKWRIAEYRSAQAFFANVNC